MITAKQVRVIDCSAEVPKDVTDVKTAKEEYIARHIPGALFLDLENLRDKSSPYPNMVPAPSQFKSHVQSLGIGLETPIVTYDTTDGKWATRGAFLFKYYGHTNVRILDGGRAAWMHHFRHDETKMAKGESQPGNDKDFDYKPDPDLLTSYDQIQLLMKGKKPFQIVDGRPKEVFEKGNIPGSINVPMSKLILDGFIQDKLQLNEIFRKAGVDTNHHLVFTCG